MHSLTYDIALQTPEQSIENNRALSSVNCVEAAVQEEGPSSKKSANTNEKTWGSFNHFGQN